MMNIGERNQIQGFSGRDIGIRDAREYQYWQNVIEEAYPGLRCTVIMRPHTISIRTDSYADYLLAKSVVSKRTGMEVVRG